MMNESEWPSEWLRGVLMPCVLNILVGETTYGYVISQRLTAAGLGKIKGGTLYPLLGRLEKDGLVSIEWRAGEGGPGRKYYSLTATGREQANSSTEDWKRFSNAVSALLNSTQNENRGNQHG
ncbi:PadR family transcriptional regulator PadR [Arthrobacter pigmenti]|uniref:PadR family transcriptional regulator PadR n=2 Tax=Arthrobacter pigmenti TaxID=271432 RepID=A0A846RVD7_9MICC|nr:PadR family transcriptional regulator PadR [Arthrobacter pigmenti]